MIPMALLIDGALKNTFSGLQVIELRMNDLRINQKSVSLEAFKMEVQQKVRESFSSMEVIRDQPIFRAYRDFFWRVGIDPTKTRPAGEALTRRIVGGKDLPTINTLVDSYNLASVMTSIAIAAFDIDSVSEENLFMRKAREGEKFKGIGMDSEVNLKGIEVVIEDLESHKLVAIYPYRDSDDSKVSLESKNVLLMMCGVPGVPLERLEEARKLSKEYVERFC
jgi:DNA/RNA-binding domain of Phe-tRNA-synthetase-like protein